MAKNEGAVTNWGKAAMADVPGKPRKVFDEDDHERNQARAEKWMTRQGYKKVDRTTWTKG